MILVKIVAIRAYDIEMEIISNGIVPEGTFI
jgi:hypothetical protein